MLVFRQTFFVGDDHGRHNNGFVFFVHETSWCYYFVTADERFEFFKFWGQNNFDNVNETFSGFESFGVFLS